MNFISVLLFAGALNSTDTTKPPQVIYKDSSGTVILTDSMVGAMVLSFEYEVRPYNYPEFRLYRNSEATISLMKSKKPDPSPSFSDGEIYPTFTAMDLNGKQVSLESMKGKIIVINYWFINCFPCRREMPDLNKLVEDYKANENIVFISIATDAGDELRKFLEKNTFNYTIIPAGRSMMGNKQINIFPTHLVVNKQGKIAFHGIGGGPNSIYWLRKTLEELTTTK